MRKTIVLALLFAACGQPKKQEATAEKAGPDVKAAASAQPAPTEAAPSAQIVNQGALAVVRNDLKPTADSVKMAYAGSVSFKGELEVAGSYRAHYEYPEVKEACFWVDPNEWKKVPRVAGDERVVWFCFTNKDEAIAKLGALGTNVQATIVIDDYTTHVERSDVWDTARLVRVVSKTKL